MRDGADWTIYVDGVLEGVTVDSYGDGVNYQGSEIGIARDGDACDGVLPSFVGGIADVATFGSPLSATQIEGECAAVGGCAQAPLLGAPLSGPYTYAGGSPSAACSCGAGGSSQAAQPARGKPVNTATGDFYESYQNVSVPGAGVPLDLTSTYSSAAALGGSGSSMGPGWASNLSMSLAYDQLAGKVTITEENGAQITFSSYGSGSPSWCSPGFNWCPDAPRTIATLEEATDGEGNPTGWTFTRDLQPQTKFSFDAAGALASISDSAGNSVAAQDVGPGVDDCAAGTCTVWTSSASGRMLTLQFEDSLLVAAYGNSGSPTPQTARFCYYGFEIGGCSPPGSGGQTGDLYSVTEPDGTTTTFTYNASNEVLQRSGPAAGQVLTNQYDADGRVSQQQDESGQVTTFTYSGDPVTGGTTEVDVYPAGQSNPADVTLYTYSQGLLVSQVDGWGSAAQSTLMMGRDPVTGLVTASSDGDGNVSADVLASSTLSPTTALAAGDVTSTVDAVGNTTQTAYTALNEPWCTVDAAAYADGVSCPVAEPPEPAAGTGQVAGDGCVGSAAAGDLVCPTFTYYDGGGEPLAVTDARGFTNVTAYTSAEQPYCTVDTYQYSVVGTKCPATPPTSPPTGQATGYTATIYDAAGDVTSTTNPTGGTTSYTYAPDSAYPSAPVTSTEADGTTTSYVYDAAGRVVGQTQAFGTYSATTITGYDAVGGTYCAISPLDYAKGSTACPADTTATATFQLPEATIMVGSTTDFDTSKPLALPTAAGVQAVNCTGATPTTFTGCSGGSGVVAAGSSVVQAVAAPGNGADPWPGDSITLFDADSRPLFAINALGGITQTAYDQAGNVFCTVPPTAYADGVRCPSSPPSQPPTGTATGYSLSLFDAQGRVTSTTDALGDTTAFVYDPAGNVISQTVTDAASSPTTDPPTTTDYQYDADNRKVATCTNADGLADYTPGSCAPLVVTAVSCGYFSTSCAAVDNAGSAGPLEGSAPPYGFSRIDGTDSFTGVSCTASFCAAVDNAGNAFTLSGSSWSDATSIDGSTPLDGVGCATTSKCIAVDRDGNAVATSNGGSTWTSTDIDGANTLSAIACPDTASVLCVAVDAAGKALVTTDGSTWAATDIDGTSALTAIACPATAATLCVAVDAAGNALVTTDGSTWTKTDIDGTNPLTAISCLGGQDYCVAGDNAGNALTYQGGSWTSTSVDGTSAVTAVGCMSYYGACYVFDDAGNLAYVAQGTLVIPPAAVTPVHDTKTTSAYDPNGNVYCAVSAAAISLDTFICPAWEPGWIGQPPSPLGSQPGSYSYTPSGNQANGISLSFYDDTGNLVQQTTPGLGSTQGDAPTPDISTTYSSFDPDGRVSCSVDPTNVAGYIQAYAQDHGADPTSLTAVCPTSFGASQAGDTTTVYTDLGQPSSVTDPLGNTTRYQYDPAGDTTTMADPLGDTTTYCYFSQTTGCAATAGWTSNAPVDTGHVLDAVSCPTTGFCTAVDNAGHAAMYNGASWATADIDLSRALDSVSCASPTFCAAGDGSGHATTFNGATWTTPATIDSTRAINGMSCPSPSLCVAVGGGGYALTYNGSAWAAPAPVDGTRALKAVSCPTTTFCMAVDGSGYAVTYNGTSWATPTDIDASRSVNAVSCATTDMCVAVDASGHALVYTAGSWSAAATVDGTRSLGAVSCATATFCIATDSTGHEVAYNGSSWHPYVQIDGSANLKGISCAEDVFCIAVDNAGHGLAFNGTGPADAVWSTTTPASYADPNGELTTYTYRQDGSTGTTTTPAGTTTSTYDPMGDVLSTVSSDTAAGYVAPPPVSYTYNQDGSRHTMSDGTGTTTYTYDTVGDQTQTDLAAAPGSGLSNATVTYRYDAQGKLGSITYPSYGSVVDPTATYTYDSAGNMASVTDWNNNTVTFTTTSTSVTQANEVTSEDPDGTSSTTSNLDLSGRTIDTSTETTATTTGITPQSLAGAAGSPTPSPTEATATSYFGTAPQPGTAPTAMPSCLPGRPCSISDLWSPSGAQATAGAAGAETACTPTSGIFNQFFGDGSDGSRNPDGQVVAETDTYADNCQNYTTASRYYSYDPAGQLTYQGDTPQGAAPDNFATDAAGNLTTISSHGTAGSFNTYTQVPDAAGETLVQQPSTGPDTTYSYDTIGDRTQTAGGSDATYSYDQDGQMVGFSQGTTTTVYTYDGDGLEASWQVAGSHPVTQLLWDTTATLPLLLSDGADYYIYGPGDTPVEQDNVTTTPPSSNPTFMTYFPDNSAWIITNTAGEATNYYRYDAYGTLSNGQPGSAFGYAGQYTDNTSTNPSGLSNMRARWYDPTTGKFLTVDPAVAITDAPYTYAGDDPINNSDPTGLCWGPGCWVESAANTVANGAATAWNATGGKVVHAAATGTYGVCISGAIGWGPGGTADGCFVESHFFQHGGFTGTLGGGGQSPTAGIGIGFLSSNASSPGQLSGPFGYANGNVVVGPDVGLYAGGEGFIGKDSCNSTIVGSVSGVGLGADLPLPFGFGGGASYTWVGQAW